MPVLGAMRSGPTAMSGSSFDNLSLSNLINQGQTEMDMKSNDTISSNNGICDGID